MGRVNIELDENVHRLSKAICALENKTLTDFINDAIREKLSKEKALKDDKLKI